MRTMAKSEFSSMMSVSCYAIVLGAILSSSSVAGMGLAEKSVAKLEWNSRVAWKELYSKVFTNDFTVQDSMKPEETLNQLKRLKADLSSISSLGEDGVKYIFSMSNDKLEEELAELDKLGKNWPGSQESIWLDVFGIFKKAEKIDELIEMANVTKEKCEIVHLVRLQELFTIDYSQEYVNINPYLESVRKNLFEFCGINLEHELREALPLDTIPSEKMTELQLIQNLIKLSGNPEPHREISRPSLIEAVSDYVTCRKVDIAEQSKPSDVEVEGYEELPMFSPYCSPISNDETSAWRRYYDFFREFIDEESMDQAWRNTQNAQNRLGLIRMCNYLQDGVVTRNELERVVKAKQIAGGEQSCERLSAAVN